jgi:hypothetical protein
VEGGSLAGYESASVLSNIFSRIATVSSGVTQRSSGSRFGTAEEFVIGSVSGERRTRTVVASGQPTVQQCSAEVQSQPRSLSRRPSVARFAFHCGLRVLEEVFERLLHRLTVHDGNRCCPAEFLWSKSGHSSPRVHTREFRHLTSWPATVPFHNLSCRMFIEQPYLIDSRRPNKAGRSRHLGTDLQAKAARDAPGERVHLFLGFGFHARVGPKA